MGYVRGLQCRECETEYAKPTRKQEVLYVCEQCFGPLKIRYDFAAIARNISRRKIEEGPSSMWRYGDLLPIDGEPTSGLETGYTPLIEANELARALGMNKGTVYVKNDTENKPTNSFKDRVVAVALTKARELGFDTVACASTGNLAQSLAEQGRVAGFETYVFIPAGIEEGKIQRIAKSQPHLLAVRGVYDEVNRLCTEIGANVPWAFVNVNLRPFYGDGSKTYGYEVIEQLGWKTPDHIILPVAGSSLITKVDSAFKEMKLLGFIENDTARIHAAQDSECPPVVNAIHNYYRQLAQGTKNPDVIIRPIPRENTALAYAQSIAIGNPADGVSGLDTVTKRSGYGEAATRDETLKALALLKETQGIAAGPEGGVVLAVTKKLIESGRIRPDELTVVGITGADKPAQPLSFSLDDVLVTIEPTIDALNAALKF